MGEELDVLKRSGDPLLGDLIRSETGGFLSFVENLPESGG